MSTEPNKSDCGLATLLAGFACCVLSCLTAAHGQPAQRTISLAMSETPLSEVMNMLSQQERVNILMSDDVNTSVSFNLFDVTVSDAISAIANAAGYAVERRGGNYFVIEREEAGRFATGDLTQVRTFKLQYTPPDELEAMLTPYLSDYGQLSILRERRLLTIEDMPEFLDRFAALIRDVDREPQQILIEAKILEVTLNADDAYGIDWSDLFTVRDSEGAFGTQGLLEAGGASSAGFFLSATDEQLQLIFNALEARGRVRTLSTPRLLAVENQEASVIVGDRRGFQVTTTINQVTSETIEFLESGVILRVTPQVDDNGSIMLNVHPEVSTGNVDSNGIPSQVTTEVTTRLLVPSGRTAFIGGLIKHTSALNQTGVPVLRRVPGLRRLFSNEVRAETNSETIVLITPRLVDSLDDAWNAVPTQKVDETQRAVDREFEVMDSDLSRFDRDEAAAD
jgi:type II secretory pathway component GspD/PulD (secretin)